MAEANQTMPLRPEGIFVGREKEMGWLQDAVRQTIAGEGRVMMLSGDSGIGKTWTAQELSTFAKKLDVQVIWGHCYEAKGVPPYWPWVQVIRTYIDSQKPAWLRRNLGKAAGVIARIVPELEERLGDLSAPPALGDHESERFRLFDSVARLLRTASAEQPLLIVLDDLHWSDEPSLKLLEFVAHELNDYRLVVVGTYRDVGLPPPLSKTLIELKRVRRFEGIPIRRLAKGEVSRLVELSAGIKPSPALVDTIHALTDGNPLFTSEVIRYLAREGRLSSRTLPKNQSLHLKIPEGVRETISQRLDRLTESCNRLLRVASVVGREFGLDMLPCLVDDPDRDHIAIGIEEALANRIVEELPGVVGRYRFSHHLIQEILKNGLTSVDQARLHARIAEALEELYADALDEHAAELATHFTEARTILGNKKLIRYSLMAGKRAADRSAYEEAIAINLRAIEATKEQVIDDGIAELFYAGADQQHMSWEDHEAVIKTATRVFDYYEKAGQVAGMARTAGKMRFFAGSHSGLADSDFSEYCRRTLELYDKEPLDDPKTLCLLSELQLFLTGNYKKAERMIERALPIAEEQGDETLRWKILRTWAQLEQKTGRSYSSARHYELAAKLPAKSIDQYSKWAFYAELVSVDMMTGNPDGAERHSVLEAKAADILNHPRIKAAVFEHRQEIARKKGNWQTARKCFERGMRIVKQRGGPSTVKCQLIAGAALTEYEVGELELGKVYTERLLEYWRGPDTHQMTRISIAFAMIPKILRITGSERWLDLSAEIAESARHFRPWKWPPASFMGLIAALRGDSRGAGIWYDVLFERKGEIGGHLGHSLGMIARAAGRLEEAIAHFEEGYVFRRDAGYLPDQAWVCRDYAEALLDHGGENEPETAKLLLDEGLEITERLGMKPLRKDILELREGFTSILPKYPDGLTGREVEVLRLVSKGMTNQEVGNELSISERTVAAHLRHIFDKVGAANRAEAAVYALRSGIVPKANKQPQMFHSKAVVNDL